MKLSGNVIGKPKPKVVVIPRGTEQHVFHVGPVTDWDTFNKLCPEPEIIYITRPGQAPVPDLEDKKYSEALNTYATRRVTYMFVRSLLDYTEGLEFELIDPLDPTTWDKLGEEFDKSGFTPVETNAILNAIKEVNGLSPELIEEATQSFLRNQALQAGN